MDRINEFSYKEDFSEELRDCEVKKPGLKQLGILYSISILLFAFVGSRVQKFEFTFGILVTEFILILLPPLLFLYIYKYDFKKVLRLNRLGLLNAFLIFCIMLFALPVVGVFNAANLALIKYIFGKVIIAQPPMLTGPFSLILNILLIAGTAGICEETLYRGVIQRGFERFGTIKSILAAAFLFSLAHLDFQKLLGIILLGSLIGFIVYRTNSIFGGMLAHFTNNAIAVVATFLSDYFKDAAKNSGLGATNSIQNVDEYFASLSNMPKVQLIAFIITAVFIVLVCSAILVGLIIGLIKNTEVKPEGGVLGKIEKQNYRYLLWFLPGVAMVGFVYFAEGLKLRGISIEGIDIVLRIIGLK